MGFGGDEQGNVVRFCGAVDLVEGCGGEVGGYPGAC